MEKEDVLADLKARAEDTSQLQQIYSLFEQSGLFVCQALNSTSYHRRKSILGTILDRKTKAREILKEHSGSLNHIDNNCLLRSHSESEFSKSINANKK